MPEEIKNIHVVGPSDKLFKVMISVVSIAAVFLAGELVYQFNSLPQNIPHEITVSGTGKAYAKPDIAMVSFSSHAEAPKSQDAVNQSNARMNAIIEAVKGQGVLDKDIQTTLYNLQPLYDYQVINQPMAPNGAMPVRSGNVFRGYSLDQQISVKIRNFDNINAILDKATAAGATSVGDLQFSVDNPETTNAQARALAIADAKKKLQDIMKQSGLSVGKLVNISEGYNSYPQPMYATGMAKDSVASVAPQIQTGQQEIDSNVTLTYQVK